MSGSLQHVEDDGARCKVCAALAVGPCARCAAPLCGDCCVIVRGRATPYAVCPSCAKPAATLGAAWNGLVVWLLGVFVLLAVATAFVGWLAGRR